jgi:hypothetical protein
MEIISLRRKNVSFKRIKRKLWPVGVIIEIHEEWMTGSQYLNMSPLLSRGSTTEQT